MWIPAPWSTCNEINFSTEPRVNECIAWTKKKKRNDKRYPWNCSTLEFQTEIPKYYLDALHCIDVELHPSFKLDTFNINGNSSKHNEDNCRIHCITSNRRNNRKWAKTIKEQRKTGMLLAAKSDNTLLFSIHVHCWRLVVRARSVLFSENIRAATQKHYTARDARKKTPVILQSSIHSLSEFRSQFMCVYVWRECRRERKCAKYSPFSNNI